MTSLGMSTEAVTAPSQACSMQDADSLASLCSWEHLAAKFSDDSSSPCRATATFLSHLTSHLFACISYEK